MEAIIKAYFTLPERLGWRIKKIVFPGRDKVKLREILEKLPELEKTMEEYEKTGFSLVVMINGRRIEFLGGLDAEVRDGDEVSIFPPAAGG